MVGKNLPAFSSNSWLVVEPYPSEKYELVKWDDDIPNRWKNKKCSKPPTSVCWFINHEIIPINYSYIYHKPCSKPPTR